MIHTTKITLFCFVFILLSCSVGVNTDMSTGLTYKYNGFYVDNVYMSVKQKVLNKSEVLQGQKVYLYFTGFSGYKKVNGKGTINWEMAFKNKEGQEVIHKKGAIDISKSLSEQGDVRLNLHFVATEPLHPGETYTWETKLHDQHGEGRMATSVDITIKALDTVGNVLPVQADTVHCGFSKSELRINDYPVEIANPTMGDQISMNFFNIRGFQKKNDSFEIWYNIRIKEHDHDTFLYDYVDIIKTDEIEILNSYITLGKPMETDKSYTYQTIFKDMNSSARLNGKVDIDVE